MLQTRVRDAMQKVQLVGGDTMNYWISGHRQNLDKMLKRVDVLLINDGEAKMLAGDNSLPRAARKVMEMGPRALVIKHGEYGATIFFRDRRVRRRAIIRSARPPCRSTKSAILPAQATASPAASWATLRRRARSTAAC